MTSRRKLSPAPLPTPDPSLPLRRLAASTARTLALPTAAALLVMGAVACSSRASSDADVHADLPTRHALASNTSTPVTTPTGAPTTAPTTGGLAIVAPIDPEPQNVKGESAIVVPTPPKGPPKKPLPPTLPPMPKPPHLGGAVAITDPSI